MIQLNNYHEFVDFYKSNLKGTGYLAFRDLPLIFKDYKYLKNVLDFGCGAGRSSVMLKKLDLKVTGVDIDTYLIEEAKKNYGNHMDFQLIVNNKIPFPDKSFDIVFNSFVLFDVPSKEGLVNIFKEMRRVCIDTGLVISVVNSNYLFNKRWLTVDNNFPQNVNLKSGDIAKIYLNDVDIELYDYYWEEKDYIDSMQKIGLEVLNIHKPLGNNKEEYDWKDEVFYPPYSIFICQKSI